MLDNMENWGKNSVFPDQTSEAGLSEGLFNSSFGGMQILAKYIRVYIFLMLFMFLKLPFPQNPPTNACGRLSSTIMILSYVFSRP